MHFHQKIRAATQPYHDQTEQLLARPVAAFTLADYRQFLLTNWLFHQSLENTLTNFLPEPLKTKLRWQDRRKAHRLQQDLHELATDYSALTPLSFTVDTLPEALGAMYVAEGATLGGMMMMKMWKDHPVIGRQSSFAFLGCYGKQTGSFWKSFLHMLEETVSHSADEEVAIASAQATFRFYATCHHRMQESCSGSSIIF